MTNAIILAGGFGTRLRDVVNDVPKPLAPVGGRPFLDLQLDWLSGVDVKTVVVTAHYMAEKIAAYVEDHHAQGAMNLMVVVEDEPLGTGGAVVNAFRESGLVGDTLVMNGDTYYDFDLKDFLRAHGSSNALVTMAVVLVSDCARYGTVDIQDGNISAFAAAAGEAVSGLVSCGIYILSAAAFDDALQGAFSIEADFFTDLAKRGEIAAYILESEADFFDIGIPKAYAEFCKRF